MDKKRLFYENFSDRFDEEMNKYDLNKRLNIIFEKLLISGEITGKRILDIGCGTGWFSKRATQLGADVFSVDIGISLLKKVSQKCNSKIMVSDLSSLGIKDEMFDYVLATEVIEHVINPKVALNEISKVLKKEGILLITVPNRIWYFSAYFANLLKIRKYEGYENWVGYYQLQKWLKEVGFEVETIFGFHLFPFVFPFLNPLLNKLDSFSRYYSPLMLNIAAKCKKIAVNL